jgi:hypothetical protein
MPSPPKKTQQQLSDASASLTTRITVVERDVSSVVGAFEKFERAIEKFSDVSSSLKELLAVHDTRLMEREKADLTIFELIERRKEEYSRGIERMHQRIEDLSTEVRKQIHEEINEQYEALRGDFKKYEETHHSYMSNLDKRFEGVAEARAKLLELRDKAIECQEKRIRALENWRWAIVGIGIAIGFLVKVLPAFFQTLGH